MFINAIPAPGCAFCETAGRAKCEGHAPQGGVEEPVPPLCINHINN